MSALKGWRLGEDNIGFMFEFSCLRAGNTAREGAGVCAAGFRIPKLLTSLRKASLQRTTPSTVSELAE